MPTIRWHPSDDHAHQTNSLIIQKYIACPGSSQSHLELHLWVIVSSAGDVIVISALATLGVAMAALPLFVVLSTLGTAIVFAFALDTVKVPVFHRLKIS